MTKNICRIFGGFLAVRKVPFRQFPPNGASGPHIWRLNWRILTAPGRIGGGIGGNLAEEKFQRRKGASANPPIGLRVPSRSPKLPELAEAHPSVAAVDVWASGIEA